MHLKWQCKHSFLEVLPLHSLTSAMLHNESIQGDGYYHQKNNTVYLLFSSFATYDYVI